MQLSLPSVLAPAHARAFLLRISPAHTRLPAPRIASALGSRTVAASGGFLGGSWKKIRAFKKNVQRDSSALPVIYTLNAAALWVVAKKSCDLCRSAKRIYDLFSIGIHTHHSKQVV